MAQSCKKLRRCNCAGVSSACHCLLCSFVCTHILICINICIRTINKDINYFIEYCKNYGLCNSKIGNKPKQPSCHFMKILSILFLLLIYFFQEGKREQVNLEMSPWLLRDSRNWILFVMNTTGLEVFYLYLNFHSIFLSAPFRYWRPQLDCPGHSLFQVEQSWFSQPFIPRSTLSCQTEQQHISNINYTSLFFTPSPLFPSLPTLRASL